MNLLPLATTVIIALGSTTLWADCTTPSAPDLLDGATAEEDAFIAGYKQAKAYLAEAEAFLECLQKEEAAEVAEGIATDETKAARLELYNATVDEMQAVGDNLNAEVREFKARSQ